MTHIHSYGCFSKTPTGGLALTCGHPLGPEATALLEALNEDNQLEFDRISKVIEDRIKKELAG
jgi:hypothetical protein